MNTPTAPLKSTLQRKAQTLLTRVVLGFALMLKTVPLQAATLTLSNLNTDFDGYHALADLAGTPLGATGAAGNIGLMTITDGEITTLVTARNFTALNAAFVPFGTSGGTFLLNSAGANGAVESSLDNDTRASQNAFGGSSIYVWLYKGTSRTSATEFFLAKLSSLFPTDPEGGPPSGPDDVFLRPSTVATLFAGASGPQTFDYGLGSAATIFRMASASVPSSNQPPVANSGTLDAIAGVAKNGQLTGSDPDDDDLTFLKVTDPTKGTVVVQSGGSFTYTAGAGQTGADSFTFKVNDGELDSAPATITITISPTPPNQPPVGVPAVVKMFQNDAHNGFMSATDPEGDTLTYAVVGGPANGSVEFATNGWFKYLPNNQFVGEDSFTFTANDGEFTSAPVRVVFLVQTPSPGWTWMTGEQAANLNGIYGSLGTASATNRPGARSLSATASSGAVMYLFGGQGRGEAGTAGLLNDLWKFDSATQEWTWLAGGKGINAAGDYGTLGAAAAERVPGGRSGGALWVDDEGKVWLFGGSGRGSSASATGELNDLWRFDPASGHWAWLGGSNAVNANGAYGSKGVPSVANVPGARSGAAAWKDGRGHLWLFGGRGRGATGATTGLLNDLWKYDPSDGEWAHMHGSTAVNAFGKYPSDTVQVAEPGPGGRSGASVWLDSAGRLWLFGGQGLADKGKVGFLNDLWIFDTVAMKWKGSVFRPSSGTWRTSPGPVGVNLSGVNGVLGVESLDNYPAARAGAVAGMTGDGKLILFGGSGTGSYNDVWSFDTATFSWTWLKGHARTNQKGVYGQKGVSSASNTPGARGGSAGFLAPTGHLWVFNGAAGATGFSDGWRLRLPANPRAELAVVNVTGETTAELSGMVYPNVAEGETTIVVDYAPLTANGITYSVSLPSLPPGSGATPITQQLTGLQPGTEYQVNLSVTNAAGNSYSPQRIFRTQGAPPPLTVQFASVFSNAYENLGTALVEVTLSAPASETVTVPVTVSGTSTATSGDYSLPAAQVVFLPGQSTAFFVVNLVNDIFEEAPKSIILDLGTPVPGAVTLGTNTSHEVNLEDDDAAPFGMLSSELAQVGQAAQLRVNMSTVEAFRYQWKKAGKRIPGATGPVLAFPSVKLADAGAYSVDVTLPRGGVLSLSAQLAVVDTTPRRVLQRPGVEIKLTNVLVGTGLQFEWQRVGDPTVLATTQDLTFPDPQLADSGDYTCTMLLPGAAGQLVSPVTLNVVTVAPQFAAGQLPDGYVGSTYLHVLAADNAPLGEADSFTVTGLPKGLVADARGRISGVPLSPVTNKLVTVILRNPVQSVQATVFLTIQPLPAALAGSYGVSFDNTPSFAGTGVGGRMDVTVTPSGSFTATVITGTDTRKTRGPVTVLANGTDLRITAELVKKGAPTLQIDLEILGTSATGVGEVSGTILDKTNSVTVPVQGVRSAAQTTRAGTYTFGLLLDDMQDGVLSVPQGEGFGTATLLTSGRATFAGRAADGSTYTASSVVGKDGDIPAYFSVASLTTPGGITGMVDATVATAAPFINHLSASLTWTRAPALAKAKTRGYRAGFSQVPLELVGGVYQGPAAGGIIAGFSPGPDNVEILFENRALIEGQLASLTFTIANAGGVKQKVTLPASNPAKVTFILGKAPGSFSGGFTLPGTTKALDRKATYEGRFVRTQTGAFMPVGFFLIALPPEPGQTPASAPEVSGRVVFD